MPYIIKSLLPITPLQLYKNTQDSDIPVLKAVNIVLSNNSGSAVDVNLSFYSPKLSENFEMGAVLFGYEIPANTSIVVQDRYIYLDDIVEAYASVMDVVSISIDVEGDNGRYSTPLP